MLRKEAKNPNPLWPGSPGEEGAVQVAQIMVDRSTAAIPSGKMDVLLP